MASITATMKTVPSEFQLQLRTSRQFSVTSCRSYILTGRNTTCINFCNVQKYLCRRLLIHHSPHRRGPTHFPRQISASSSGLEASITDQKDNAITLKNAEIVIESQDENKIQLKVQLPGDETQKVFDKVLANLASTAPPVPGFRRQKGGKTSQVPKSFLLQIIGEERVTKFVIQEIVNSSLADYVKKENLKVKDNKINTTQTAAELKSLFTPGKEFGFNAIVELENSETETLS